MEGEVHEQPLRIDLPQFLIHQIATLGASTAGALTSPR
jgi:hypothetical protein